MTANPNPVQPISNSHILTGEFNYHEPATLTEAVTLLHQGGPTARLIAGGTHLLTMLKMERDHPETLISLQRIPGLNQVRPTPAGGLEIGACATIRALRNDPAVRRLYPALAEACAAFGSTQVQIMGTLGGNLCNGSPASDTVPALMIYEAELVLQGPAGSRRLPLPQFLVRPGQTALQSGEILTSVILPPPPGAVSTFQKISRASADLAKASIALLIVRDGDRVNECRMALGSVAPTVLRLPRAEALLAGKTFSAGLLTAAGQAVSADISPIDDVRSSAWYRRQIAAVMVHDAFHLLWQPAGPLTRLGDNAPLPPAAPAQTGSLQVNKGQQTLLRLKVNGQDRQLWVSPHSLLLNVLREDLELTGAKYGCGLGECSACTVLVDGQPRLACITLAASVAGRAIVTVEGLEKPDGTLDPLQEAFIDQSAFQCGYCTPGFLTTLKGLLSELPHPAEDDIRDYLKGNRCRCTGYVSIVKAVNTCVERMGVSPG